MANIKENLFLRVLTTPSASTGGRVRIPRRSAPEPHDRRNGDERQLGVGDRERAPASKHADVRAVVHIFGQPPSPASRLFSLVIDSRGFGASL